MRQLLPGAPHSGKDDDEECEYAPDLMVLPGPGNTLGGVVAQVMIAEGWRGLRSKADFQVMQKSEDPPIESMRRV